MNAVDDLAKDEARRWVGRLVLATVAYIGALDLWWAWDEVAYAVDGRTVGVWLFTVAAHAAAILVVAALVPGIWWLTHRRHPRRRRRSLILWAQFLLIVCAAQAWFFYTGATS